MPNRMLRESIRTSPTLAQLSHGAERLFVRLLTFADDYGRFDADPAVVLGACMPRLMGAVKRHHVVTWLGEMVSVGLVRTYSSGGKPFGMFITWGRHQRIRAMQSKYPPPTSADIGGHPLSNVPVVGVVDVDVVEDGDGVVDVTPSGGPPAAPGGSEAWNGYSQAYQRRYGVQPVRNAKVNSQLCLLVKRIPSAEAPEVAAWYVGNNAALYVRAGHPVDLLLRDAEKLRTEWATGQRGTETGARASDQRQERGGIAERLLKKAATQEGRHAER